VGIGQWSVKGRSVCSHHRQLTTAPRPGMAFAASVATGDDG
jgi:hypothetical protein